MNLLRKIRKEFEERFPMPNTMFWDKDGYWFNEIPATEEEKRYRAKWEGFKVAAELFHQPGDPVAYLRWDQGMLAIDDYVDYLEVCEKNDVNIDGTPAFPVYMRPSVTEAPKTTAEAKELIAMGLNWLKKNNPDEVGTPPKTTVPQGYQVIPISPGHDIISAMACSQATDDEGEFPTLSGHLDYSGENKTHAVIRAAYAAIIEATSETNNE